MDEVFAAEVAHAISNLGAEPELASREERLAIGSTFLQNAAELTMLAERDDNDLGVLLVMTPMREIRCGWRFTWAMRSASWSSSSSAAADAIASMLPCVSLIVFAATMYSAPPLELLSTSKPGRFKQTECWSAQFFAVAARSFSHAYSRARAARENERTPHF